MNPNSSLSLPLIFSSLVGLYLYSRRHSNFPPPNPHPNTSYVNRHGDVESSSALTREDWARRWNKAQTFWHKASAHPLLVKYVSVFPQPSASSSPSILIPLCGKTVDLIYLAELGYSVIGVELVSAAIQQFFDENRHKISGYNVKHVNDEITVYTANNYNICLLCCDIYSQELKRELMNGGVDCIWDRAAYVAINRIDRARYMKKLISLLKPKQEAMHTFLSNTINHQKVQSILSNEGNEEELSSNVNILLSVWCYPQWEFHGPPFSVSDAEISQVLTRVAKNDLIIENDSNSWGNDRQISYDELAAYKAGNRIEGEGLFQVRLLEDVPTTMAGNNFQVNRDRVYAIKLN
jgi:hypothetical protein